VDEKSLCLCGGKPLSAHFDDFNGELSVPPLSLMVRVRVSLSIKCVCGVRHIEYLSVLNVPGRVVCAVPKETRKKHAGLVN
jgi:hypothetical protein